MIVIHSTPVYENGETRQKKINEIYVELFKVLNEGGHIRTKPGS